MRTHLSIVERGVRVSTVRLDDGMCPQAPPRLLMSVSDMLISLATRGATAEARPLTWKQVNKAVPVPQDPAPDVRAASASDSHFSKQ